MIPSKEDILKNAFDAGFDRGEFVNSDGSPSPDFPEWIKKNTDDIDEYSKQIAIGFAKYAMQNTIQEMNVLDLEGHQDKWELESSQELTNDELYQSYLNTLIQ